MRSLDRPVLLILVLVTGFAALAYELLWIRMFTLVFGATVLAASTVLAAFFTGLALGSLIFGRLVDRFGRPLLLYGLLEAGVGLYSLVFPEMLAALQAAYADWAGDLAHSHLVLSLVRFVAGFAVLLVPSTLMGGALPVVTRYWTGAPAHLGRAVGYLYAVNTLGAATGCLATGFLLIEALGVDTTHRLAIALSLAVAVVATGLHLARTVRPVPAKRPAQGALQGDPPAPLPSASGFTPYSRQVVRVCMGVYALSAATALGYEVLWTRTVGVSLQSTIYSLTLILTTFLVGLALGGYLVAQLVQRLRRPVLVLAGIQVAVGIYCLGLVPFFDFVPEIAASIIGPLESDWTRLVAVQFLLCFGVMLIPTLLIGSCFPLACRIGASRAATVGSTVGRVGAIGSLGAIVGSLTVGFVAIPLLGIQYAMMAVALVNLLGGTAALAVWPEATRRQRGLALAATAAIAVTGLAAAGGADLTVGAGASASNRRILFYDDGPVANVRVEQTGDDVVLLINDKVQAGMRGARSSQGLGHIPLLLHHDPRDVLAIGLGAGMTAGAVSRHPIERLRIVDVVGSLRESSRYFLAQNHGVLDHAAVEFLVADGRNSLLTSPDRFDVIISDIFFPAGTGTGSLYALEIYELARLRLREPGVMVQWLPLYQLSEAEFKIIAATFQQAFPHVELWLGDPDLLYPVVGLVGRSAPYRIDPVSLTERLASPGISESLVYGEDPLGLLAAYFARGEDLAEYIGAAPLNTDDRPRIEFSAPRNNYVGQRLGWTNLQSLVGLKSSVAPLLDLGRVPPEGREAFLQRVRNVETARLQYYSGTFALGEGRLEEGYQAFLEARALAPQDVFLDFHTSESIGRLHIELGDLERAATLLEAAVRLRPSEVGPRMALAEVYARQSEWGRAEEHLAEVGRIHPDHLTALSRLGDLYIGQERWTEALSVLERALGVLPAADERTRRLHQRALRNVKSAVPR